MIDLSICVLASVREKAVKRLVQSLEFDTQIHYELIVVNNSDPHTKDAKNRPENLSPNIPWIDFSWYNIERPISISEHRKVALDKAEKRYVWLLDDDLIVDADAALSLYNTISRRDNIDIISCIWKEEGDVRPNDRRPAGSNIYIAESDGEHICFNERVRASKFNETNIELVKLDIVQGGSVMIDTKSVKNVSWDKRYKHFFEIEDYFMQCRNQQINVWCDLTTEITHDHLEYPDTTLRHEYNREADRKRLEDKWSMRFTG